MSTTSVGPLELYYEEHGSGDPLLLIMGFGVDSRGWRYQIPEFSQHYRTIVFDNRGIGRSAKPPGPYTIGQMVGDTAGLMDALGVDRAHVVGISMGGMIAQELTLTHPDRVRGLVLSSTYAEPDEHVKGVREAAVNTFGGSVGADGATSIDVSSLDPISMFQHLLPTVLNEEFIQNEMPTIMQFVMESLSFGVDFGAILGQMEACMGHDTTDRLGQIKAPTLVMTGDADGFIPHTNSDLLHERIPGSRLVKLAGGSHGYNFETPDEFNREVLGFLRSAES